MIAGLVLAAGAGRRFGGIKQLAQLDGLPLVVHAVRAQLGVGVIERVAVVVGAHHEEVEAALPQDVDVVLCLGWDEGMGASVRAGLAALPEAEWIVITLADQPRITSEVIAMAIAHMDDEHEAVRAVYDGEPGHRVVLGPALLARPDQLAGDAGFRELLDHASVRLVEAGHLCSPADVDTPQDLEEMSA